MGFVSGSVTFRRYRIEGWNRADIDDAFVEALTTCAFGRYRTAADDGIQLGWVTPLHVLDAEFAGEKISAGGFAHFAMRLDRNTPPAAIKRSYFEIERLAALEASGRDFLSKRDLKEARDNAARRADKEALSGAFRRISTYPIVVDLEKGMLYFGSASTGVNEQMQRLFIDTFDVKLFTMTTHDLTVSMGEAHGLTRDIEDAKPVHWISPPDDTDGEYGGLDPADRSFLGREFLSWLWFHVETSEGVIALSNGTDALLSVVNQANLRCDFNLSGAISVRADAPARMAESKAALASGKQPSRIGLLLASRSGEWSLSLDGPSMGVFGLQIPKDESAEKDGSQMLESRCESVVNVCETLDLVLEKFVCLRFSKQWEEEHAKIAMWVAQFDPSESKAAPRLASAG
ncbi:MAG: hypothetical protein GXP29_10565 [Planctomycetes bacterium]|nr:hypothetical protein [Planctomycetota bacterium]